MAEQLWLDESLTPIIDKTLETETRSLSVRNDQRSTAPLPLFKTQIGLNILLTKANPLLVLLARLHQHPPPFESHWLHTIRDELFLLCEELEKSHYSQEIIQWVRLVFCYGFDDVFHEEVIPPFNHYFLGSTHRADQNTWQQLRQNTENKKAYQEALPLLYFILRFSNDKPDLAQKEMIWQLYEKIRDQYPMVKQTSVVLSNPPRIPIPSKKMSISLCGSLLILFYGGVFYCSQLLSSPIHQQLQNIAQTINEVDDLA